MLLVRCPYSDCGHTFTVSKELSWRHGQCQSCGKAITLRESAILSRIEHEHAKRAARNLNIGHGGGEDLTNSSQHASTLEPGFMLSALIEDVRSLFNVGSIFRTADGAGFSNLYLCGITGCPPRKEIAKTSLGAENNVGWQSFVSALDVIPILKKSGVVVLGLERNNESIELSELLKSGKVTKPVCLIVGNEVTGLSAESLAHCDYVVHLPMRGVKESLNVSVAFGIAAYAIADAL